MTSELPRRRRGTSMVESAIVIGAVLLLLFAIFEYGRFLMMKNALENAAREGARFAVVHTHDKTEQDIKDEILVRLGGLDSKFGNYTVVIKGKVLRTGESGTEGDLLTNWSDASPTDGVFVEITGDYSPVLLPLPYGLGLPTSVTMRATAVMYSEAN